MTVLQFRPTSISQLSSGGPAPTPVGALHSQAVYPYVAAEPKYEWKEVVHNRLQELLGLQVGWDGYSAGPVSIETAYFTITLLSKICVADVPAPQIVPGYRGDLQLEWHTKDLEIELHVRGPNDVLGWRELADGTDEEIPLKQDFSEIVRWLQGAPRSRDAAVA